MFVHMCTFSLRNLLLGEEGLVLLLRLDEGFLEEVGILAVGEADRERLSLGLALADIRGGIPDPAAVAADVGRQLHVGDDVVVGADLEGLVTPHD